ncbi:MAG TPA: RloB family protein [Candidatus Ligilactobacillus excrementipullorum]|nr:RloB family protein [Candidatus Ligilactobacillus excrementipullorum]
MGRKSRGLPQKKSTVIYCEGQSEVQYFQMLARKYSRKNVSPQKIMIKSMAKSGLSLLDGAWRMEKDRHHEKVYVVFDRDALTNAELSQCQKLAKQYHFQILFSCINFEVWILLHFEYFETSYTPAQLVKKLSGKNFFATDYQKFKGQPYDDFLLNRVGVAMKNATLLARTNQNWLQSNPYTNLHHYLPEIFSVCKF